MKIWKWALIITGGVLVILGFLLIVPVIILDKSWWWFFAPFIFFAFVGIIVGIIFLVLKLRKPKPTIIKIDMKDAKHRVIEEVKNDEDNPDNFKIDKSKLFKIGEKGAERTPIGVFDGYGTEKNERRVAVVNLNNPKKETTHLPDPSEKEIEEAIRLIADNPPEEKIQESTSVFDPFTGRSITSTRIGKPSQYTKQIEQEKKEAEEVSAI